MQETKTINPFFADKVLQLDTIIHNFDNTGTPFGNQKRNSLKLFDLNGLTVNVKSFKVPNIINQIAYRFFRKSKAQRSFEYANKLIELGIDTPKPLAYYEYKSFLFFKKSFYLSEQQESDLTYRELTKDLNYPNHEDILRAFTRFTYSLHEKQVKFLDHSPGNTLIKKNVDNYAFFLVDLNRMEFKPMNLNERIKNFAKLTVHKSMVKIMSDEYAKCCNEDFAKVFDLMWENTQNFQEKYWRRRRLKNKLKFWRKNINFLVYTVLFQ